MYICCSKDDGVSSDKKLLRKNNKTKNISEKEDDKIEVNASKDEVKSSKSKIVVPQRNNKINLQRPRRMINKKKPIDESLSGELDKSQKPEDDIYDKSNKSGIE